MRQASRQTKRRKPEHAAHPADYSLSLYVSGVTPRSVNAIENVQAICAEYLTGRYTLEIIDIYQNPERVRADQVIAVPTLIRRLPEPRRLLVGDMSDRERVLAGLGLRPLSA